MAAHLVVKTTNSAKIDPAEFPYSAPTDLRHHAVRTAIGVVATTIQVTCEKFGWVLGSLLEE